MGKRTVALACALFVSANAYAAGTAREMYAAALTREKAVRQTLVESLPSPDLLKEGRSVVAAYEHLVRRHRASGYSDDALWQAGHLALDLFSTFGEPRDRSTGVQLLKRLAADYPTSRLAKRVAGELDQLDRREAALAEAHPATVFPASIVSGVSRTPSSGTNGPPPDVPLATVTAVRRTVLPEAVRITIELDREVSFHDERIDNPSRVFVDLNAARAATSLLDKTLRFDGDDDLVRQVRLGRHPSHVTRVVLDAVGVSEYNVYAAYSPFRLVIDCLRPNGRGKLAATPKPTAPLAAPPPPLLASHRASADWGRTLPRIAVPALPAAMPVVVAVLPAAAPAAAPEPPVAAAPSAGFSIARQLGLGVSRIVIDPGHGGHDPGAKGKGITEAELTLDVALRLEKLLQKLPGVEVILTRRTDDFVPLQERTAIANREGADLFLSIHANASSTPEARGVETYFLNFANNLSAAAVAARENAASGQAMGALPDLVKAIALNNKLDESKDFAGEVQRAMIERLRGPNKTLKNLGVKQAPFVVLIGAAMPSVLAEISFVTNPPEAKLLRGSAYRDRIAEALMNAIKRYQASLKAVTTVAHQ